MLQSCCQESESPDVTSAGIHHYTLCLPLNAPEEIEDGAKSAFCHSCPPQQEVWRYFNDTTCVCMKGFCTTFLVNSDPVGDLLPVPLAVLPLCSLLALFVRPLAVRAVTLTGLAHLLPVLHLQLHIPMNSQTSCEKHTHTPQNTCKVQP